MVQHFWWDSVESEIHAQKFTHKFTPGSQIHETVNEFHVNLPHSPLFRFPTALKAFICPSF